jgi:diguanylate cyclase (GGDEF)-like protein
MLRWTSAALALLVLGLGTGTSAVAATYRRTTVEAQGRADFAVTTANLSTQIGSEVFRAYDLVLAAGSYVSETPEGTNASFVRWFAQAGSSRQHAALGLSFIQRVKRADLPQFLAERAKDTSSPFREPAPVTPVTDHDELCVPRYADPNALRLTVGTSKTAASLDVCAFESMAAQWWQIADSGSLYVLSTAVAPPVKDTSGADMSARLARVAGGSISIVAPVYRGVPTSTAERRSLLLGWVDMFFDGPSLIRPAVTSAPTGVSVRLLWRGAGTQSVVASTPGLSGPTSHATRQFDADGRWLLEVDGAATGVLASARTEGWLVFGVGFFLTLLLTALLLVLLGARNRALRLVARRTEELHQQTLHDALTGLANRVLAIDRTGQMLARARRDGTAPAALFLDIDDFKHINDSLGHEAGDDLLVAVATRLHSAVRASETVARLSGDEFLVLTDGASPAADPEALAQRILDLMAEPFHVGAHDASVTVSFSIGVAVGDRADADELLRDADLALYQAKAAGKSCYVVFTPAPEGPRWHQVTTA